MNTFEKLQQEENQIRLKEETLQDEQHQVRGIKETYMDHFRHAERLLDSLCTQFQNNDRSFLFVSAMDEATRNSRQVMNHLEIEEENLSAKKKKLQEQLTTISCQKRHALVEEERHEY